MKLGRKINGERKFISNTSINCLWFKDLIIHVGNKVEINNIWVWLYHKSNPNV